MPKRLIYAEDAIEYFMDNTNWHDEDGYTIEDAEAKRKILTDHFKGVPSAQPEIIRCKDCKYIEEHHYEENGEPPIIKYTCVNKAGLAKGFQVHEWEFCSRAERKDDE